MASWLSVATRASVSIQFRAVRGGSGNEGLRFRGFGVYKGFRGLGFRVYMGFRSPYWGARRPVDHRVKGGVLAFLGSVSSQSFSKEPSCSWWVLLGLGAYCRGLNN